MQPLRNAIGKHVRGSCSTRLRQLCASSDGAGSGDLTTRVLELVKKFGRIDSRKAVSEIADFHKDLSLDSLDRVELIMAIEQEFSVEIPDKEDKLSCCADVVKYIAETQKIKNASERVKFPSTRTILMNLNYLNNSDKLLESFKVA